MSDKDKSKKQLLEELIVVRRRIKDLEKLENKRVQESLKETQIRLEGILSSMVDLVFAIDKEGRFIFYRAPSVEDLYLPPEQFIGKKHSEILPPHMIGSFEDAFKKNKDGEIVEYEYWLEMKGIKRWYFAKLSPLFLDGKFAGSLAVIRDITERKHTQQELKKYREHLEELVEDRTAELKTATENLQQEVTERKRAEHELRKFKTITDKASYGAAISDLEGHLLYVNDAFAQMHQYSPEKLIGMHLSIFHNKEQMLKVNELNKKLKKEKSYVAEEVWHKRKDGSVFPTLMSATLIFHEKQPLYLSATAIDITERKRAEIELEKSESELKKQKMALEQKNIALGEIIAQIEIEKRKIKEDILTNANIVLSPILEKLREGDSTQKDLSLFQHHIDGLTSSYGTKITDKELLLTPKEIEICNLVKAGFASKDISRFLNISRQTVEGHRKKIRRKLGLANKNINLTTYLREL
jgi:PAS domain S-box-containing protein